MAILALIVYLLYGLLAFGLRSLLQWRATGSTGFHGVGGKPGSLEWLAGVGFVVAIVLGALAPVLALLGLEPIGPFDRPSLQWLGLLIALAGVALTLQAQFAMGSAWRIGVDPSERTELVTEGAFAIVRNPIFAAMIPTALGIALMVPNIASALAFVGLVVALELQVRVVEEPYLVRTHGGRYLDYAARVGRFLPGVGRSPTQAAASHRLLCAATSEPDERSSTVDQRLDLGS